MGRTRTGSFADACFPCYSIDLVLQITGYLIYIFFGLFFIIVEGGVNIIIHVEF